MLTRVMITMDGPDLLNNCSREGPFCLLGSKRIIGVKNVIAIITTNPLRFNVLILNYSIF